MNYQSGLKALRAKLIEKSTGAPAPQEKSLESFIPSRFQNQMPQETPEDLMSKSANWMSEIKKATIEFKKAQEMTRSIRPAPNPFTAAAEGFLDQRKTRKEEPEPTKEERREAFISRRGENSPSTYGPERPEEREGRLDAENPGRVKIKFKGKDEFVDSLYPKAIAIGRQIGVDPRIILAQAALETGWGKSVAGNNFFGIKSHGRKGGVTVGTSEEVNGEMVRIRDSFRAYADADESFQDYADFLATNDRYLPMLAAKGLDAQLEALGRSGYATDSKYTQKLRSIINNLPAPEDYL